MTLDVYSHVMPDDEIAVAALVGALTEEGGVTT
jgi:hypothetical protein